MANNTNVYSSGGVGDALIVGLKIQQMNAKGQWIQWEKHECHRKPILDVMRCFTPRAEVRISDSPEKDAKEYAELHGGQYVNTVITGINWPYLNVPIHSPNSFNASGHICVQLLAGRMNDSTRRSISPFVINELYHKFPGKRIVLLAPEPVHCQEFIGLVNLTGKTESVVDALDAINDCSLFIGQDGVLAYYAMMLHKPTIVAYHLPNLLRHYWNGKWATHSLALCGSGNCLHMLPVSSKVEELFNMVRKNDEINRRTQRR